MPKTKSKTPFININREKVDLRKKEQPLLDIKVTNPITYLKTWWKRVLGNEGIDFRFRIKPLTAIAISVVIMVFGFGIGKIAPPVDVKEESAMIGVLHFSKETQKHYLITNDSKAIEIELPADFDGMGYYRKGVLVEGTYSKTANTITASVISPIN